VLKTHGLKSLSQVKQLRKKTHKYIRSVQSVAKDKFSILHLKPCFKIVSERIGRLRLKFRHMLLTR